ncbi:MAG: hypothetical protein JNN13_09995 [Planctomycetes bacterium]|nr:hypothetical protein [Planctomycetota bacterium]
MRTTPLRTKTSIVGSPCRRPRYRQRSALRAWLGFAFTTLLGIEAALAQQPTAADDELPGTRLPPVTVQNLAPFARREGVAVVVPFAPGQAADDRPWHIAQHVTAWAPFGMRWPDGSWRQALCEFVAELPAVGERQFRLRPGPGEALPTDDFAAPVAKLTFVLRQGERQQRAEPVAVATLEATALRRVELRRARLGDSGLVAELIVTWWRDQPHADVDVAVFCSDPRLAAMQCDVDELAIESSGMALYLRHAGSLGMGSNPTADGNRTVLLRSRAIGDGQGLRRSGALVPRLSGRDATVDQTLQAACIAPLLGATTWRDSGAFGPFGVVPDLPPWLAGNAARDHLAHRHRVFVDRAGGGGGDPFAAFPFGLAKMAGQTGDQGDFGVCKLSLVAATGLPSLLLEAELSVMQEACRPVHFFEADGSPVDPADHPDWVVWSGRTHWHADVSKDRLGKPVPAPRFEANGWTGKDREHWSSNYLAAFALLTGSHWARAELANEARLYLAGQTLAPQLSTSNTGAPRGAGRTALAAAWNLLVSDDPLLRRRMNERLDQVEYPQWSGRELAPGQVRAYGVNRPDPRMLQGKFPYWNPWQDALAGLGFGAHFQVTGNPRARELAEALATNVLQHGWLVDDRDCKVALAIRWLDGAPFTADQWLSQDRTLVQWPDGSGFALWSLPAVEIARVAALRAGDEALASKAAAIQRRLRAGRTPPRPDYPTLGGLDQLTEWDAVRWH